MLAQRNGHAFACSELINTSRFSMKNFLRILLATVTFALVTANAVAEERGTKQEAVALVEAALAHIKKVGVERAFDDFNKDKTAWVKKDLYVFADDFDGLAKANGGNEKLVGKVILHLKDQNGKEFVKEMVSTVSTKGEGWVDYDWLSPVTKKVEAKSSYVKRIPDANMFVGVGVYR
jgi:cytochrome c